MTEFCVIIDEDNDTIVVVTEGKQHSADLTDTDTGVVLTDVIGDENILRAALSAWDGQEGTWAITEEELRHRGGGWLR